MGETANKISSIDADKSKVTLENNPLKNIRLPEKIEPVNKERNTSGLIKHKTLKEQEKTLGEKGFSR